MCAINQCAFFVASLNLLAYFYQCQGGEQLSSSSFIGKICATKLADGDTPHPRSTTINAINRLFVCDCLIDPTASDSTANASAFKQIICAKRMLNNNYFSDYALPTTVDMLTMGWNNFDVIPEFSGSRLTKLDMSHNCITTIDDNTFENVTNLIELDLSWNSIATISAAAFRKLSKLKRLDISHNQLSHLSSNLFVELTTIEVLILSNNVQLNETFQQPDFDLFTTLGVPSSLARLEINEINLNHLNLSKAVQLTELFVRYNRFNESSHFTDTWPHTLELIDLSGNPFETIPPKFLARFSAVREVFLRRMPYLERIDENAFANLTNLIVLDMEGSRNLVEFNKNAFGGRSDIDSHISHSQHLERLNLRNTKIERLGTTLNESFHHLKRLDLYGNPLNCDCDLRWVAKLKLDTSGRCEQPDDLNGTLISNIPLKEFTCLLWPNVVYTLLHAILLLSLFAIFTIPIWLIVMYMRPHRHRERRKIGASSPYARITIESNRAEDLYF